jgi:hypothetical protein
MIVIIRSLDNTFHVPVCKSNNIHDYVNHVKHTHIMCLDFHLSAEEIGQIMGGN